MHPHPTYIKYVRKIYLIKDLCFFPTQKNVLFLPNLEWRTLTKLTHSKIITTNKRNKCNHRNCILSADDFLNRDNVSQYRIKFDLPIEIGMSKP